MSIKLLTVFTSSLLCLFYSVNCVEINRDQKSFICPCHESKFAPNGKVLGGPATESLQVYTAKLEDGKVLVKTKVL